MTSERSDPAEARERTTPAEARERTAPAEASERGQPPEAQTRVAEPRRRLHPLSPVLKSIRLIALIIVALSWQVFGQLGIARFAGLVVIILIGVGAMSVVSWWATGYHVIGRELRIYEGVISRRTRAIPLERLQAVDVVRPVMARLAGLSELRLEVIGAEKAEAPLAFLPVGEAVALRDRLLRLSARPADAGTIAEAPEALKPDAAAQERLLVAVDNNDVLLSQLLTPQVWAVPIGVLFLVVQFSVDPTWTFIGVASLITATVGVLQQPVRRVLEDWNFRISFTTAGLRLRHGLVETRTQTIPPHRVQAVGVTWPLLWRPKRWLRSRIDVAGYGSADGQGMQSGRLLPVATPETARFVIGEVLPGVDLADLPMTRPPRRARWVAPLRQRVLGAGLTDHVFVTIDGLVTRQMVIVPYIRIQSVRVVQGPWQRRFGLASVHADTAGGLHGVAQHRELADARALAAALTEQARQARGEE